MPEELEILPELAPGASALIDAYAEETARAPAEVEAALQSVTAQTAAAGSASSAGVAVTATKAAVVAVAIGAATWFAVGTPSQAPPPRSAPATTHDASTQSVDDPPAQTAPPAQTSPATLAAPEAAAAPAPTTVPPPAAPPAPKKSAHARSGDGKRVTASADAEKPSASLAEELRLLKDARAALRAGDGALALTRVQTHRRNHPTSSLAKERDATEVMALCAVGRTKKARARAAAFHRRFPGSARDLLADCGDAGTELPTNVADK